ncbi:MAG: InlB B-repeat-containing protein, partial [Clostridia bacterium]|nr:InlB B-repeat-containing protein [Clostridia bacterium]
MKKRLALLIVCILALSFAALTACEDEPVTYTVTFDSDGGTAVEAQTVVDGKKATEPTVPTKEGYTFDGWYLGTEKWSFGGHIVTSDMTLKAKWASPTTHIVTFDSDGGTSVEAQTVEDGQKATEPTAPTKEGYTFDGWYLGTEKWSFAGHIVTSDMTLKAKWTAINSGVSTPISDIVNEIINSNIEIATVTLGIRRETWSKDELKDTDYEGDSMSLNDLSALNQKLGVNFTPVFNGSARMNKSISISDNMNFAQNINTFDNEGKLFGFVPITTEMLSELGFEYVGVLPADDDEIAITEFIYTQFKRYGFKNTSTNEVITAANLTMDTAGENSIIGKHLTISVGTGIYTFKITAVIDTKVNLSRYQINTLNHSYHCLGYVTESAITSMSRNMEKWWSESAQLGESMYWSVNLKTDSSSDDMFGGGSLYLSRVGNSELIPVIGNDKITWLDGKTSLGDKEMLVSSEILSQAMNKSSVNKYDTLVAAL